MTTMENELADLGAIEHRAEPSFTADCIALLFCVMGWLFVALVLMLFCIGVSGCTTTHAESLKRIAGN